MRTFGVEEEFLLLDLRTGENMPEADKVVAALPEPMRRRSRREFRPSMMEMVTDVCVDSGELAAQVLSARRAAAEAAEATGAALVAIGATPVAERFREPADDERFRAIVAHYGPVARDPAVCGCHVHVGVPDRALAVEVCTRLRGWLPVVQALAANSPWSAGADTGYASWRCVQLERWPSLGPWPHLRSVEDFERTVAALVSSGAMMDASMVLWWARPSATFPTVEVRIADVCPRACDTVLVAALVRALVDTAAADAAAGVPAPEVSDPLLAAAHFNAARSGLAGTLLDPATGRSRPAWELVGELLDRVTPALRRHGDLDLVTAELTRVRRDGTGAARQLADARTGGLLSMLARLAASTVR
ncbi:carboxylate-amine ligase [Actinoplanes teichomyceticus]|uniref:Putative glutamate--cysteine ligase 2 n=1 Tax=Actinoplanes teichomyceticus TaxID=1867 RepID=A0A561VIW3_ACTTI|nr:glutamate--cysteine ligase [Actinoplanes teichomyceticus]TWG11553.1 carboxylate-amine ligase [Actinoplanes teichomyceticus]GIF15999.1 putative glutamate--cysteine ligase 2 [Actinoplanes teichomyceticus]